MTKKVFVDMIRWLRMWKYEVEELGRIFNINDIFECSLVHFDETIDQLCAVAGFSESIKNDIYSLVLDDGLEVPVEGTDIPLTIDEEEYYTLFIDRRLN